MFRKLCLNITLFIPGILWSLTNPVQVSRACLDPLTGSVTLYYKPSSDLCGSFTEYVVYGRESSSDPYVELFKSANLTANVMNFLVPNNKRWEIFIVSRFACNGTDTLISNSVLIDNEAPGPFNLDSVSVDLNTQKLYAGWSKASEIDVADYYLFKLDVVNATNNFLRNNTKRSDSFALDTFNTAGSDNRLCISAIDSCGNQGVISDPHIPVLLSHNPMAFNDLCDKKLQINWTAYLAPNWTVGDYDIYAGTSLQTMAKVANVPAGTLTYDFNIPIQGNTYFFYVRAHERVKGFSSTSNLIKVLTTANPSNHMNRICHVDFLSSGKTEITMQYMPNPSIASVQLRRREQGMSAWSIVSTSPASTGIQTIVDAIDNENKIYEYQSSMINVCNDTFGNSEKHTNILLNKAAFVFTWNTYSNWTGQSIEDLKLYEQNNSLRTTLPVSGGPEFLSDPGFWTRYQHTHYKTDPLGNIIDSARSNYVFHLVFDTTLIPNVFRPGLEPGSKFKIVNPNLTTGQSSMLIYNRWGQIMFKGDAIEGWDGTFGNKIVPHGTYIYQVVVKNKDRAEELKGVLYIIQ